MSLKGTRLRIVGPYPRRAESFRVKRRSRSSRKEAWSLLYHRGDFRCSSRSWQSQPYRPRHLMATLRHQPFPAFQRPPLSPSSSFIATQHLSPTNFRLAIFNTVTYFPHKTSAACHPGSPLAPDQELDLPNSSLSCLVRTFCRLLVASKLTMM